MEAVALFFGILLFAGSLLICVVLANSVVVPETSPPSRPVELHVEVPQLFLAAAPPKSERLVVDRTVVNRLESYLRAEQLTAARFAVEPSVENLHRHSDAFVRLN